MPPNPAFDKLSRLGVPREISVRTVFHSFLEICSIQSNWTIVPFHRIIGSNRAGSAARSKLTGYGGGLWRKEWLLWHEGVLLV